MIPLSYLTERITIKRHLQSLVSGEPSGYWSAVHSDIPSYVEFQQETVVLETPYGDQPQVGIFIVVDDGIDLQSNDRVETNTFLDSNGNPREFRVDTLQRYPFSHREASAIEISSND